MKVSAIALFVVLLASIGLASGPPAPVDDVAYDLTFKLVGSLGPDGQHMKLTFQPSGNFEAAIVTSEPSHTPLGVFLNSRDEDDGAAVRKTSWFRNGVAVGKVMQTSMPFEKSLKATIWTLEVPKTGDTAIEVHLLHTAPVGATEGADIRYRFNGNVNDFGLSVSREFD